MTNNQSYHVGRPTTEYSNNLKLEKLNCYVGIGYELLELAKNRNNADQIYEIANTCQKLAEMDGLHNIKEWFFDFADFMDIVDFTQYSNRLISDLKDIQNTYKVAPKISSVENEILNKSTLSIHEKMMNNPKESPKYFIEMAICLDGLIKNNLLNISTARWELTNAISRPQIAQCEKLQKSLKILDTIPLPEKTYEIDINKIWDDFIQEIQSMNF